MLIAALSAVLLTPLTSFAIHTATAASTAPTSAPTTSEFSIVEFADPPTARYTGGIDGLARTSPEKGAQPQPRSAAAQAYTRHLVSTHERILASAGVQAVPDRHYTMVFNGAAVHRLTPEKKRALENTPGVKRIWRSARRQGTSTTTPSFLGLDGAQGVWQQQFGGPKDAGRGVIVGMVDAGIWPEHASFAPLSETPDQALIDQKFPPSQRVCQQGTSGPPMVCNNKVISARYFDRAYTWESPDYHSPRGYDDHGSHTASVAAGNHGVDATVRGINYGKMSGMAPGARISVYKALYKSGYIVDGDLVDLVAAVDRAVRDNVDIINYSVTTSRDGASEIEALAFYNAAAMGVTVVSTAGNDGVSYGEGGVMATSPWMISVAATTHDRPSSRQVALGNGNTVTGSGAGSQSVTGPLVHAQDVESGGAADEKPGMCWMKGTKAPDGTPRPELDPAKVKGKIVVCDRGAIARVDKSRAVKEAGGIGVLVVNGPPYDNNTFVDMLALPGLHIGRDEGIKVYSYLKEAGASATATIQGVTGTTSAPEVWNQSSRGPSGLGDGDILKPDLAAPGVNVLGAANPEASVAGGPVNSMSGTSMAAPHVAGIAALIKQKHPTWTPSMIQSALMTTTTRVDNEGKPISQGERPATPHDMGSGMVNAARSLNPGIVFETSPGEWKAFSCAVGQWQHIAPRECEGNTSKPADLNYPSISTGALTGYESFTRWITNVTDRPITISHELSTPEGYTVEVRPRRPLTIPPGQKRTIRIYVTRTTAPLNTWAFGSLTLKGDTGHQAYLPISVRASELRTPHSALQSSASTGQVKSTVTPYRTGTLSLVPLGLADEQIVPTDITPNFTTFPITIKPGTAAAAWNIPVEVPRPLAAPPYTVQVTDAKGKVVARNIDFTMYGQTVFNNPPPGEYTVRIKGELPQINVPNAPVHQYILRRDASAGAVNASMTTPAAKMNIPSEFTIAWKGAPEGVSLLGAEAFLEVDGVKQSVGVIPVIVDTHSIPKDRGAAVERSPLPR